MAENSHCKLLQLLWNSRVLRRNARWLLHFSSLWNQTNHQGNLRQNCSCNLAHGTGHLQEKHYSYFSLITFILNIFLKIYHPLTFTFFENYKLIIITIRRSRKKCHFLLIILYIKDNQVEELCFKIVHLACNMERIKFVSHLWVA